MPVKPFAELIAELGDPSLLRCCDTLQTLQVNITTRCNLACKHCHVEGDPERCEEMSHDTLKACLKLFAEGGFTTLDITGGAPELHPDYRWFVDKAARLLAEQNAGAAGADADGVDATGASAAAGAADAGAPDAKIITRTNLVILTEPGHSDLPDFWAERGIEVVASLPSWDKRNYERQRGEGLFSRALEGLRLLNAAGYGAGKGLSLHLVVNPGGAFLPPAQTSAEREFREHLKEQGLSFDHLLTITNNPTGRFAEFLTERDKLDAYLERLAASFNPATVPAMMCRTQLSVRWDGVLFDCDFNQAAELPIEGACSLASIDLARLRTRPLQLGDHCYACCAGAGSSCGGATT